MKKQFTSLRLLFLISTGLIFLNNPLCGQNKPSPIIQALKKLNLEKYMDIRASKKEVNPKDKTWTNYYFSPKDCQCVYRGDFYIAAKDKKRQSKNLIFNLQGGGACWPGVEACKSKTNEGKVRNLIYASDLERNPVRDWNTVFVPYCDGSIYMGDYAADYDQDTQTDHWHWGLRNISAGVAIAKDLYPKLANILVTGCSAGGYGSFMATMLLRLQYPDAQIYVLNESGPGLFNPKDPATWDKIKSAWNLDPILPEGCPKCDGQILYFYNWMLKYDPNLRIALYASYEDAVLAKKFLKMTPTEFKNHLVSSTEEIYQAYPDQFKRFFIKGDTHCVQDRAYEIAGTSYAEWVNYFMKDDPAWSDLLEK